MIIQNKRKTVFENQVIHLIKLSRNCLCDFCGMGGNGADFFRFRLFIDKRFVEATEVPVVQSQHTFFYNLLMDGRIPGEYVGIICNTCARRKYTEKDRKKNVKELEISLSGGDSREKQIAERALRLAGFGGEADALAQATTAGPIETGLRQVLEEVARAETAKKCATAVVGRIMEGTGTPGLGQMVCSEEEEDGCPSQDLPDEARPDSGVATSRGIVSLALASGQSRREQAMGQGSPLTGAEMLSLQRLEDVRFQLEADEERRLSSLRSVPEGRL